MICKRCGVEIEDGAALCPQCGLPPDEGRPEETPPVVTAGEETPEEAVPVVTDGEEAPEEAAPVVTDGEEAPEEAATVAMDGEETPEETPPAAEVEEGAADAPQRAEPPKRKEPIWLFAILGVVAIAAVAILIFGLSRSGKKAPEAPEEHPAVSAPENGEQDALEQPSDSEEPSQTELGETYTVPNEEITAEMAGRAAASCGGRELSNTELSYYYWNQFYSWANMYGDYLNLVLDVETPLSEQPCPDDPERSWESFLLDAALKTFQQTAVIVDAAEQAGFAIDQENSQYLELLPDTLAGSAERLEIDSADEFLQSLYGPYADVESYTQFVRDSLISYGYLNELFAGITYDEADVEAWFDENQSYFEEMGLSRDEPNMVNVRHILIKPAASEEDESGEGEPTDQDWVDAKNRAEQLLADWSAGEATEDAFALLASENSEDPGSQGTGGLYEGVYPGEMVAAFNDWCFDESRKPGDTGIVETEYGYHIMYFSATQDHAHWYEEAEKDYLANRQQEILDELTADSPLQANYDNIVLMESKALE